jgi:hypothetical protein
MTFVRRHKLISAFGAIAMVIVIVFLATAVYVANVAGELPWQTDPTRVADSITPFAGLDVFIPPTRVPTGTATPTP